MFSTPMTTIRKKAITVNYTIPLVMAFVSLLVFLGLMAETIAKGGFFGIDSSVNSWVISVQSSWLTPVAIFIGLVFDPVGIVIIMLASAIYLKFKRSGRDSLMFIFLILISVALIELFKFLVQRGRPADMITGESGYSFPSGHATMAAILFGSLIYLTYIKGISKFPRRVITVVSIFMILLIGFDRIYLNVHWLSDIIGGYALGTFLVSGTVILRTIREASRTGRPSPS